MPPSRRRKALFFAATLLAVSSLLVVTSAASTNGALKPLFVGSKFPFERSLTRGHTVALAVRVGEMVDGNLTPIEGASVALSRPGESKRPDGSPQRVVEKKTDDDGAAVFEVKPGKYVIHVSAGNLSASNETVLKESTRVHLFFDEDGIAHWGEVSHKRMERDGDMATLSVRVMKRSSGSSAEPAAGALVEVFRFAGGERELVANASTGPRGFAEFQLHEGKFLVRVTYGNASAERSGSLQGPTALGVLFEDGQGTWVRREGKHEPAPAPKRGGESSDRRGADKD